jgi:hypothetical protein
MKYHNFRSNCGRKTVACLVFVISLMLPPIDSPAETIGTEIYSVELLLADDMGYGNVYDIPRTSVQASVQDDRIGDELPLGPVEVQLSDTIFL